MRVLALIPARGGSKAIPRKNLQPLGRRPLIAWTIDCARACDAIDAVVVSTDDDEIAATATALGAEVPFRRPVELSGDEVGDFPVYAHALEKLESGGHLPEVVVLLRPTAPFRAPEDVLGALKLLEQTEADAVRSVCRTEHHPFWMKHLDGDRLLPFDKRGDETLYPRRQLLPPVYRLNGAVDAVKVAAVPVQGPLFGGDVRGFVMPAERSIDIDSEIDLAFAESLLARLR